MRIVLPMAAGLLALAAVTGAWGHAAPERFQPGPGQVLDAPPERVEGWFTQDVRRQKDLSFLRVYLVQPDGSLGEQVDNGTPVIDDGDRRHMFVGLEPGIGPGEYVVAWQTLSDEDDESDGACYRFFVGQEHAYAAHQARSRIDAAEGCPTAAASTPPEPAATIELDAEEGEGELTVRLSTEGVTIRTPTGDGRDPTFAHYHLYLDQAPKLLHSHDGGQSATEEPDYSRDIMVVSDSYTFKDLPPGNHVVFAALFYDDHTPFDPPVVSGATLRVAGDDGGGAGAWTLVGIALAAAAGGLLVGGGVAWAMRRRR